jgi:hypothetical protein
MFLLLVVKETFAKLGMKEDSFLKLERFCLSCLEIKRLSSLEKLLVSRPTCFFFSLSKHPL